MHTRRREDLERRPAFARKVVRRRGAAKKIADRQEDFLAGRPEFKALRAEHDKNTLGATEGGKADFEGFGHRRSLGPFLGASRHQRVMESADI